MSLVWSYGITTVPSRFTTTLPTTLASLKNAGFENPTLFIDGHIGSIAPPDNYPMSQRCPKVGAYGNWILSLWELYLRSPYADRYAIFQDDMITYHNLRQYLDSSPYPKMGYLNLYTFPRNVQPGASGWYRAPQRGQGAVALVFSNQAARVMLAHTRMVDCVQDKDRGTRNIDGNVHDTMSKQGWHEYVHNPSLTQHIGHTSAIDVKHNNQTQADTFMGEAFNASSLIVAPGDAPKAPKQRVGLVGYIAATSLGRAAIAVHSHLKPDRWLARPYKPAIALEPSLTNGLVLDPTGSRLEKLVRFSDVVVFCGRPCYSNLIETCQKYHRKVVCFKTAETLEGQPGIDLWLDLPTEWTPEVIASINSKIKELY